MRLCASCSDRLPKRHPIGSDICPLCSSFWAKVFKRLTKFDPDASMYDIIRQMGGTVFNHNLQ